MPPPWPSASGIATRFATHWIADALAGDDSLDFSVLQALLGSSSEPLAGAPEATRERVSLRCLQEASSLIAAVADAAATPRVLRVDGARSGEDVLLRLIGEVESSGKLQTDLLPPFSQDIQETIRTKKLTLPETSFQLLKGVDPWITSMALQSQLEHSGAEQCDNDQSLRNGADEVSESEANLQPGSATEDRMAFEEQNADKSNFEVSGANKANQALHDDGSIMKNNTVHGGLTAQTALVSQNCNVTLHDKTSEAICFSEHTNEKNRIDVQKHNCHATMPISAKDRDGESAMKTSNEEKPDDTSPKIRVCSKDQGMDDTPEGLSQQGLCIKCGKDGQLLNCSENPKISEETNLFYCPVCFYKKATEAYQKAMTTYCEAKEILVAFLGTAQVVKQRDEQLTGVQPGAAKRVGHSNGPDMSKRNSIHQNEAYDWDEEPCQQRKKQKIDAGDNGYPKEVLNEKVPFENSGPGPASMNKHSVLLNNSKTQDKDPEKKQQAGDRETRIEAGKDISSPETRASSQRRCGRSLNQDSEADQEDSPTAPNHKRSSPPWRYMRHKKRRLQEKESAVPSKSRKGIAKQDQHVPTSPRKGKSVHPQKRCSNPVAPTERRRKLAWTAEEEACLKEAMAKFSPQDDAQIPWVHILEYGGRRFDVKRRPSDLRVKWRNMKKTDAGNLT